MTFDWWTFILQISNFLVLVWLLHHFLYKPIEKVMKERRGLVDKALDEAEAAKEAAEREKQRYAARQTALEAERQKLLAETRSLAADDREKILAAARVQADEILRDAKADIAKERQAALNDLKKEAAGVAVALAEQILAASASPQLNMTFLDKISGKIAALPNRNRKDLLSGLAADGAAILVVTARELDDSDKAAWRKRLSKTLGRQIALEFKTDPKLVDGAVVKFPRATISYSWADELARAKQDLAGAQ